MTTKEAKLVQLIARAVTGRHAMTLDGIAHDALEMIGDELNVLTFAMNEDNHGATYIDSGELEASLSFLGMRATGIAALLHAAKSGRLALNDDADDEPAVDEGEARQ